MRLFALSDVHVDYPGNAEWLDAISTADFADDLLILAGDISDLPARIRETFTTLTRRFKAVHYVPGNHELWVRRCGFHSSLDKFEAVLQLAQDHGVYCTPCQYPGLLVVPLFGWYDGTFGEPSPVLKRQWMDFRACRWGGQSDIEVTGHFIDRNAVAVEASAIVQGTPTVVSFSHFLPRIDVMPSYIPDRYRMLYPVLGSVRLDEQVRALGASVHVYGHSHVNRSVRLDGCRYINNALGGPSETRICARELRCVYETP
ncbi:MAG: metallophosphoesterase [Pseudomonadota bacterium]